MRAVVSKNLNVRVGSPSVNAPCYNYLTPGTTIEVADNPVEGDIYEGNKIWYKGLDGNFYWSGGVHIESHPDLKGIISNWGVSLLEIDKMWKETTGEKIRIAVLDTGIARDHPDFDFSKITGKNFVTRGGSIDDLDGHGTHNAGIIAAQGVSKTRGIAPDSELFIYKVMDREYSIDEKPVVNAINQAIHDNIDIISMSFALGSASSELQQKVKEASEKKIILIASSGNEGLNTDRFPSCYKECQCIGAINRVKNQTNYTSFPRKKNLDFLAPGDDIYSTYLSPQWTSLNGTSMSAAFVSGVVALLLAWTKKNKPDLNNSDVMDALKTSVDTANINKSGCGIINPNAALQILKNK